MTNVARLQLSLSDIARLAEVQRPVVSMWRRRALADHTFPSPIGVVRGEERFDAQEVSDYLALTGRGNNSEASEDLVAHAKLAQVTDLDEAVAVAGVTALLCLTAMTDEPLADLSASALRALADEADPDDNFLGREITALGSEIQLLAAHADALASASYSAEAAFERVLRQHAQLVLPSQAFTALAPAALGLVARTASALAVDADMESPFFVDVSDGSGDLLLAITSLYAGELAPCVATLALDSPTARLARRRLRVHDVHRTDVVVDDSGDFAIAGRSADDGAVHVLHLPSAGSPGLSDLEVLDAIGNLNVQLPDASRVVVIGPASALTDRPASAEIDFARDAVLRSDRLRAVIRLPQGLVVRSPRQALALWALGPAHPAVQVRDRWTVVADVSDRTLDEAVIEGVVTDVVAAMTPDDRSARGGAHPGGALFDSAEQVRGHRFRYGRRVLTSSLLPGRKALVERVAQASAVEVPETRGVELAAMIDRLVARLGDESLLAGLRVEAVPERDYPGSNAAKTTTVGRAIIDGRVRVIPGNRLDRADLSADGTGRTVIGPGEVLGDPQVGARRIDLMIFAAEYPSARLTEPGDVVICSSPRIGAMVDSSGGCVVQSPARVLRITDAGRHHLTPAMVADDVRAASSADKDWRRWSLRTIPGGIDDAFRDTTEAIDLERASLAAQLTALDQLAEAVTDGLASGSLTITRPPSIRLQTAPHEGH